MDLRGRKVLIAALSGIMIALSLFLFALYALHDWIIVDAYLMVVRHSSWLLILFTPLLSLATGIWCLRNVMHQPQLWGWRRLAGSLLLYSSFFGMAALLGLPAIVVGYLGMPRRIPPSTQPTMDWAVMQAATLVLLLVTAASGIWLIRAKTR